TSLGRRQLRKQFCASLAQATFHTASHAGTHTPRLLVWTGCETASFTTNVCGYGSLLSQGRREALGMARGRHHDPDQIGGIPGAELFHDVGAMILDGAGAYSKLAPGLLVGRAGGELLQHFALAPCQGLPS